MNRLATSWELVKASAAVLAADKELLIFPIVSAIGTLLVTLTFAVPTILAGVFDSASTSSGDISLSGIVIAFLFYLTQYFVIFFANSALVGAALIRLRGGLFGQIAASLVGLAWNIATYLVVPILVAEDLGPLDAIKRSVEYLKR